MGGDTKTILVADDDNAIRLVLNQALGRAGYEVQAVATASALWHLVEKGVGDLVITDVLMPDENGLDMIPRIRKIRPDLNVLAMSAQNTMLTALQASEKGAFDYLPKPFDLNELLALVKKALEVPAAAQTQKNEREEGEERLPLVGRSAVMQDLYRTLARLMHTDLSVMITGESGTGKELVARALHDYGKRQHGPFVAVNMAAIPRELIESELFGHEKGAFTGALAQTAGRFEQASGGTLFLDEIGDMPPEAQTRLLRVLQEGTFMRVGGHKIYHADVRIVAATHRDLTQLINQGLFREDLYYRLNVVPLRLPPLRERKEDIPELARHFLSCAAEEGLGEKSFDPKALDVLKQHTWKGNVRELENFVRRLVALSAQERISAEEVESELPYATSGYTSAETGGSAGASFHETLDAHLTAFFDGHDPDMPPVDVYRRIIAEVERPLLTKVLEFTNGNQIKAAEILGLNRNTLRKKIRELDVPVVRISR